MISKLISNEDFSVYNGENTILRKAQLRMLEILVQVSSICDKHAIPYWIDYGTLLGAVRHNGFIPWDDDLDISILKKDYTKLSKVLQKELPLNLVFQNWKNEKKLNKNGEKWLKLGLFSKPTKVLRFKAQIGISFTNAMPKRISSMATHLT